MSQEEIIKLATDATDIVKANTRDSASGSERSFWSIHQKVLRQRKWTRSGHLRRGNGCLVASARRKSHLKFAVNRGNGDAQHLRRSARIFYS